MCGTADPDTGVRFPHPTLILSQNFWLGRSGLPFRTQDGDVTYRSLNDGEGMSADAGTRTRVLALARLSDNQLHYVRSIFPDWIIRYKDCDIRPQPINHWKS